MNELDIASHAKLKCIVGGSASSWEDDVIMSMTTPLTTVRVDDVMAIVATCRATKGNQVHT